MKIELFKTAKQAREEAENTISSQTKMEMDGVFQIINKAIKEGKFEVCEEISLSDQTQIKLTELGYKISTNSHRNEYYTTIKW